MWLYKNVKCLKSHEKLFVFFCLVPFIREEEEGSKISEHLPQE